MQASGGVARYPVAARRSYPQLVAYLHGLTVKMLVQPDVKERLATLGAEGVGNTPDEFRAFVKAEIVKWARVVKEAGLKVE